MKRSRGTVIPADLRLAVLYRDRGCVGYGRLPGDCAGPLQMDHVRASGALSMKSRTTIDNLVALCAYSHHRWKTDHGRTARPILIEYLAQFYGVSDA